MESTQVAGLTLFYELAERETAEIVEKACADSIAHIGERWGLAPPVGCTVYVMASWQQFYIESPPPSWRLLLKLTGPLWQRRAAQVWPRAAGWHQRFGRRTAVGVKPARLFEDADPVMGQRIFVRFQAPDAKVRQVTCHELTHACSQHLKLPMWLFEGLAMVTVDKLMDMDTVLISSLDLLRPTDPTPPADYRQRRRTSIEDYVYQIVRGYWLTRLLNDAHLTVLKSLLTRPLKKMDMENQIASALGLSAETLWQKLDGVLVEHFRMPNSLALQQSVHTLDC